ncbi:class I glutamine amidotransferase-like protein [Fomitiporia mediterranea MF3/22]|uniref:class I glutamine amidotransferase-like protein n=1 Tax=Fomitiporia mediterranea (strain MF3/22) TaxID=694068 RepID=UPI000440976B|nr:class I glutamine amidotransferase-like protein [Fomitiporia mediterranea MF3/22]EJD03266.1 class I glutamine amidotransferase-like protein [Fomitiporia mediterranea MF3/22]
MSIPKSAPLKVGVLLCSVGVQLLDLAAVDLLAMTTPFYLKACGLPENIVNAGHDFEFRYIADVIKGNKDAPTYAEVTANVKVHITDTLDSVDKLDYLVIPGPPPSYQPSAETIAFIQKHTASVHAVLIICTGILPAAFSGILSGKRATAPLGILPLLREKLPDVKWVAKRWTVDDERKIWTSGGVTNGTDLMAAFVKELNPQVGDLACKLADVGERGEDYPEELLKMKWELK